MPIISDDRDDFSFLFFGHNRHKSAFIGTFWPVILFEFAIIFITYNTSYLPTTLRKGQGELSLLPLNLRAMSQTKREESFADITNLDHCVKARQGKVWSICALVLLGVCWIDSFGMKLHVPFSNDMRKFSLIFPFNIWQWWEIGCLYGKIACFSWCLCSSSWRKIYRRVCKPLICGTASLISGPQASKNISLTCTLNRTERVPQILPKSQVDLIMTQGSE